MNRDQLVSVIVTTKNEETVIRRLIESVKKQTYKHIEIILVDNNSTDKTVDIAKKMGVKVYNFGPERSAQRNFGAKKAKGEYFLFLDADMVLTKDVVKACVDAVQQDKKTGAVTILEKSVARNFWEKVKAFERSFYNLEGDEITDAARFFRREVFEKVGGYDEKITGPEDWDLTDRIKKLGFRVDVVRSLIYHHERIPSLFVLIKKKFYYGLKSHRYISKQRVSVFSPKTVYLLRPVFYKNYKRLAANPLLTLGMILMLTLEQIAGFAGFILGKWKKI